ncbi:MAG TPA: FAD-dependent oxidoreductase [Micromonosporaceae bacterium]|nr:FAD-dependent oxidoreductase [Micromonosporaceae bacterium]
MTVTVVGAGVVGLTTAAVLLERGRRVRVVAAEAPGGTTSAVAGAIWGPYRAGPPDAVERWSVAVLPALHRLAADPATGVRIGSGRVVSRDSIEEPALWRGLPEWRPCGPAELPAGVVAGWSFSAPVFDMPAYLSYLLDRVTASGGRFERRTVGSLDEADLDGVVVNCTGVGARALTGDDSLVPVRGQHVVVRNPGLTDFYIEEPGASADFVVVFPHGGHVVLGGTAVVGADDRAPDPVTADAIVARCARVFPELRDAPVLRHAVGLRPARPAVRVEAERLPSGRWCVHNYGHGGAGVTLSWGCAEEVAAIVASLPR